MLILYLSVVVIAGNTLDSSNKIAKRRKMSMKKKLQKDLMMVTGKVVRTLVKKEQSKWPPHCLGILNQPKRPIKR